MPTDFYEELHLDFEVKSEIDLTTAGIMRYATHESTSPILLSYHFGNDGKNSAPKLWDYGYGTFPKEIIEAVEDPRVMKVAFNAAFERLIFKHSLKVKTNYEDWRCGMALAYFMSFIGGLGQVSESLGLGADKQKMTDGKRLINLFCMPQRITKKQPHRWRDELTDPDDWETFRNYCIQDTVAEMAQWVRFSRFDIDAEAEWRTYAFDQRVNDRGYPLDMTFIRNAIDMVEKRKAELLDEMRGITGLANPNSPKQLLPWLKARGYPYNDLQKPHVKKAKTAYELYDEKGAADLPGWNMTDDAYEALTRRRWTASTAASKYEVYRKREVNGRYMHGLQIAAASRSRRWGGRGAQPHNQARTPKDLETPKDRRRIDGHFGKLKVATDIVRSGDYEMLKLFSKEPMEVLAGAVRSAIRAPEGKELRVSDLTSIESLGVAYLTECERMLNVFRNGKDIYKDFGTLMYGKAYDDITSTERTESKPAILGAGYGLGGGGIDARGELTGLWGYADSMGIKMTKEAAHESVRIFREQYAPEVASSWYEIDNAIRAVLKDGKTRKVRKLRFQYKQPYLLIWLPSGRAIYYYKPKITKVRKTSPRTGNVYDSFQFSYMGKSKVGNQWVEVQSWGGKVIENVTQAFARDVLRDKLLQMDDEGFNLVLHVHDEGVACEDVNDTVHTQKRMDEIMCLPVPYAPDLPLGSAGYSNVFYLKD